MRAPFLALALLASSPLPAATPAAWEVIDEGGGAYLFRYEDHQSLFVVTPDGVIVTDPIGLNRPEVDRLYLAAIRRITNTPIRYLVYSHIHYDHAAGGSIFADEGAVVVAHERVKARLKRVPMPQIVMPAMTVGDGVAAIELGGTRFEMIGLGPAHSDTMLVFRLPKQGIIFTVDWVSVGEGPGTWFGHDMYPGQYVEALDGLLALDWTTMLTGHTMAGGRTGTRADAQMLRDYHAMLRGTTATLFATQPAGPPVNTGLCTPAGAAGATLPARFGNYVTDAAFRAHLDRYCLFQLQGF